jgi:hypothetical protein
VPFHVKNHQLGKFKPPGIHVTEKQIEKLLKELNTGAKSKTKEQIEELFQQAQAELDKSEKTWEKIEELFQLLERARAEQFT